MDPNAIHEPQAKHDHKHKGTAIADQRQWHPRDREQSDRHSHVLEDKREDERRYSYNQKES